MHWISPVDSVDCTIRLFEHIISAYNPNEAKNLVDIINPNSLTLIKNAKVNKAAVQSITFLFKLNNRFEKSIMYIIGKNWLFLP